MFTHAMDQVVRDEELLNIARDYLNFVTRFFEPISVSAVHIYHSALELSPLSSIVRRVYYHRRHTPFPRVVSGIADLWDQSIHLCFIRSNWPYTWSPCGRFIAALADEGVEIRDALCSELVSTGSGSGAHFFNEFAYSPDGRLLAHLSDALVIWDVQTGGIVKEVQCGKSYSKSMVWSSDGEMIGIAQGSVVCVCDVASGTMRSIGTLQSRNSLRLWAHDGSFRAMATGPCCQGSTIEIFDVGSDLTKIESFCIEPPWKDHRIESFSPTTHRISIRARYPPHVMHGLDLDCLCVLDIRDSRYLLEKRGDFNFHSFSSDGSLFAACLNSDDIHVWKYAFGYYILLGEFPTQGSEYCHPQFSPNLSSILTCFEGVLQVHRLDDNPIVARPGRHTPLAVISHCGTYVATGRRRNGTITITNLLLKTTPQFVDTGMEVYQLAITGNVLLVEDPGTITAWKLTEEGRVDGVPESKRAGRCNSIWTISVTTLVDFAIKEQSVIIHHRGEFIHAYHAATGEVLKPAQAGFSPSEYADRDVYICQHHLHYRGANEQGTLPEDNWPVPAVSSQMAWVKDPEGRHRLWVPVKWRTHYDAGWLYNIKTLRLDLQDEGVIFVKL